MVRIHGEITIARPVEEVFDVATDGRNEPRYNPAMVHVDKVTPGPVGRGTRFVATLRSGRRSLRMTSEITAYDRPVRSASTTRMSWMTVRGTLTFVPVAEGTSMRWDWEVQPRGVLRWAGPLVGVVGRRQERAIWSGMKRDLETGERSAPLSPDPAEPTR